MFSTQLVIILAVIVILMIGGGVAAFVVYAVRKDRKSNAVLIGINGILKGKTYTVKDILTIGRNSDRCEVTYPMNTEGISGIHCQIQRQGNGYMIIDMGSSYGTYLGNDVKLQPNVPTQIASGDYFYLANREQLFQIRY